MLSSAAAPSTGTLSVLEQQSRESAVAQQPLLSERCIGSADTPLICSVPEQKPLGEVLRHAGKKALGGGVPGAAAMALQVCR